MILAGKNQGNRNKKNLPGPLCTPQLPRFYHFSDFPGQLPATAVTQRIITFLPNSKQL
jgi:hypothetical protein